MLWRLLQGLEESVERLLGQHVHLVNDVHLVMSDLRRNAHLVHQLSDILHRVVGCSVQLENVQGTLLVECAAGLTVVAGFSVCLKVQAVDGLGQNARASGLAHASGSTEQIRLGYFTREDGILQRGGQCSLSNDQLKIPGTVFSCGYNVFSHVCLSGGCMSPASGKEKFSHSQWGMPAWLVLTNLILLPLSKGMVFQEDSCPAPILFVSFPARRTMERLKAFFAALLKQKYLKYIITLAIFALVICFLDGENNIFRRMDLNRQISNLKVEIDNYRKEYDENTRKLELLQSDTVSIEKIARENYFMKKPNEDIFVFKEDLE